MQNAKAKREAQQAEVGSLGRGGDSVCLEVVGLAAMGVVGVGVGEVAMELEQTGITASQSRSGGNSGMYARSEGRD